MVPLMLESPDSLKCVESLNKYAFYQVCLEPVSWFYYIQGIKKAFFKNLVHFDFSLVLHNILSSRIITNVLLQPT